MLRLAVTGGGCSGFQYNFALDETRMDDDLFIEEGGAKILIDPGVAGFPGRRRDRFHRRPDRPGLQGQQSQRHLVLRLRHQLFGLTVGMKIATWNVNSIKVRLEPALAWLKEAKPDVVALQEIKCLDENFPAEPFEALGYNCAVHGQKDL